MGKTERDWSKTKRTKSPYQVSLRLTKEEYEQLETITQQLGVSKAGYVKSATFGRPIPRASRRPQAVAADLRQLLGLMGKLGSNANQIARLCNTGALLYQREALESLQAIQRELAAMRALLLRALKVEP